MKNSIGSTAAAVLVCLLAAGSAQAQGVNNAPRSGCSVLPSWDQLRSALSAAREAGTKTILKT